MPTDPRRLPPLASGAARTSRRRAARRNAPRDRHARPARGSFAAPASTRQPPPTSFGSRSSSSAAWSGAGRRAEAPPARELAVRKGAGNVVELGSIAAFGFSPLWLLAGASDVLHGSRVYLNALVEELRRAGVVGDELDVGSVDDLLRALEEGSGGTARLIDIPPVELAGLRASLAELRGSADALPSPGELAAVFEGLRRTAAAERRPLLEVSTGVGLAFLSSARSVSREHVLVPYREDLRPVRDEGFGAYAVAVSRAVRARDRVALPDRPS